MVSVTAEDTLHLQANSIPRTNLHKLLPIECFVGLQEGEEDFVEDLLRHFRQLMKKLGFEGGGPCSPTLLEAMEDTGNCNAAPVCQLITPDNAFHITCTIPIPLNYLSPLRTRTNVCHVHSVGSLPYLNAV